MSDDDSTDSTTTDLPQLDAFGTTRAADLPRARLADPVTSHAAARRARLGLTRKQIAVLDVLQRQHAAQGGPLTYDALIDRYRVLRARSTSARFYPAQTDSGIRSRCKELRDAGHVRHVDYAGTTAAGGKAARWATTPEGQCVDLVAQLAATRTPP